MSISPIELRHKLHMNPELAFNEFSTQAILEENLENLGLHPVKIAKTGLLVYIEREKNKPSILYRADMDALPITEDTGCEFSSRNNNMHACGHDIHMSVMYGVIKRIIEEDMPGNFVFVFQPAEETIGGAKYVIDEMREKYKITCATALHVTDEYALGEVASSSGTLFACAMEITAKFRGRAAHIAQKQNGIDAMKNAVAFLNHFYNTPYDNDSTGSRLLVGFGKMFAGSVRNAVADFAQVEGSIRGEKLELVVDTFSEIEKTLINYDGTLERGSLYPPVVNDEELLSLFRRFTSSANLRYIDCGMKYTGEDFGFFTMKYPSLMFWAGVRTKEQSHGLHNPHFLPDDEVIPFLTDSMVKWLNELWNSID